MKTLRVLLFLVFSTLDVVVRAESLSILKEPILEPTKCLSKNVICSISTYKDTKYQMVMGSTRLRIGPEAILTRLDRNQFALVKGTIWLETEEAMTLETEFGQIKIVHKGQVFVEREPKRVTIQALDGEILLQPKGGSELILEAGFENILRPVTNTGRAETGIPQLIDPRLALRKLGDLHFGSKNEFISWSKHWLSGWPNLVETASQFHQDLMNRSIASEEDRKARIAARRRAIQLENRALVDKFRKKTLSW